MVLRKGLGKRMKRQSIHNTAARVSAWILLIGGLLLRAQTPAETKKAITPDEAKQLFSMVDELLRFDSQETGLKLQGSVKRQLISRAETENFLKKRFDEDDGARRLENSEVVLKKFGLLDRDFDLKPFLLRLLTEQVEAFYDGKTKSIFMLDWVAPDEQKPVLAHELTHALQDQRVDLEKWGNQTPLDVSRTSATDKEHVSRDEIDAAREAVLEGQATAVMFDYMLRPVGKSLVKDPEVAETLQANMNASADSPVLARAPLLLSESLIFPYREGLGFTQDVWMDEGQAAAFAGTMDRPPSSSWEIMSPREYEKRHKPSVPMLPDVHPLLDAAYEPVDIGQVGQLDLRILTTLFGGERAARELTSAWDGGLYWAGRARSATAEQKNNTSSLALFYLSAWKSEAAARHFFSLYAENLNRKYGALKPVPIDAASAIAPVDEELHFTSNEGPMLLARRGKCVFVAESFAWATAAKLTQRMLDAQSSGPASLAEAHPLETLSAPYTRMFREAGVMKVVVEAMRKASKQ